LAAHGSEPNVQRHVRFPFAIWQQAGEQARSINHILGDLVWGVRDEVRRFEAVLGVGLIVLCSPVTLPTSPLDQRNP